jgi:dUTP pyrophosphatase
MTDTSKDRIKVALKKMPHGQDLDLPAYATPGSAGVDLRAAIDEPLTLAPGQIALVPTGIAVAIPQGFEGQIRPRSGLATKHGISLINAPGTVDSDFRGEMRCSLINLGQKPYTVNRGDRISQMIIAPVFQAEFEEVAELPQSERGGGGWGSTGK